MSPVVSICSWHLPEATAEALRLVEEPGDVADSGAFLDEEEGGGEAVPDAGRHDQARELPLHHGVAAAAVGSVRRIFTYNLVYHKDEECNVTTFLITCITFISSFRELCIKLNLAFY